MNNGQISIRDALYEAPGPKTRNGHIVFDDLFCKIGKIPNGTIIRHRGKQGQQDG